ncbi:MAG: hypothetical protein NTAFB05_06710 [Nitrobacter sp.]
MPQDQALRQRIANLTDADLQRAAVLDEPRRVQADGVFGIRHGLGRRREQRKIGLGAVQDGAEFAGRQIASAGHERQLRIDLSHQLERRPAGGAGAQQVERGVGVAAQTVARLAVHDAFGHELGDDVEAAVEDVGCGMGVVGGDVVLLGIGVAQPLARQEEELGDLDVRRQLAFVQGGGVVEVGPATEQAIDHRCDESLFQFARRPRLLQRQRREESQVEVAIGCGALVERIDDVIGLAEPERQSHHQTRADVADDVIDDRGGVGENFGHQQMVRMSIGAPSRLARCGPRRNDIIVIRSVP